MLESIDKTTNHEADLRSHTETQKGPKKRVIIVEDHPLVRERLAQLINHELDMVICGEAENVEQAVQITRDTSPNLAVVDISLRNSNGLDVIKAIRSHNAQVPVLVLSMHEETLYAERAMRAGANGYITKHQPVEQILLAIRRVISGADLSARRISPTLI